VIALIIAYLIFLIAFSIYSYFALYHLQEYGNIGDASKIVLVSYIFLSAAVVIITFVIFISRILA